MCYLSLSGENRSEKSLNERIRNAIFAKMVRTWESVAAPFQGQGRGGALPTGMVGALGAALVVPAVLPLRFGSTWEKITCLYQLFPFKL